ncbi:hypothetical protein LB450_12375 [Psychroflexus sp. CAK1W]|uniref:sulfotransferase n=1 Tax=Psychroflexus curvus TaxID=2873595 RepID=UPI001CD0131F|nr:sulfotransferase [Psychroflexus curvus]MBZ9628902.1 hypothetical protein [Psychroflexus curvus]
MGIIKKLNFKINGFLNKTQRKKKVFCVGLHKTGTTTLSNLFKQYGFYAIHSVDWEYDEDKLNKYDFFSDGGSHFDGINEFDVDRLRKKFPGAFFILQTRDTKKWIISKLKHAGWEKDTKTVDFNKSELSHSDWRFKSLFIIENLIEHKINYENKLKKYFNRSTNNFLVIDITDKQRQKEEFNRLKKFVNLKSINKIDLPHSNKQKSISLLNEDVLNCIDKFIK